MWVSADKMLTIWSVGLAGQGFAAYLAGSASKSLALVEFPTPIDCLKVTPRRRGTGATIARWYQALGAGSRAPEHAHGRPARFRVNSLYLREIY